MLFNAFFGPAPYCLPRLVTKTLRVMKLASVLLLISFLHVSATGFSQKITMSFKNVPLEKVFKEVEKQTGYSILWNEKEITSHSLVDVQVNNASFQEAMDIFLKPLGLTYSLVENILVIRKSLPAPVTPRETEYPLKGTVTDNEGAPLAGISIALKGSPRGTVSDGRGAFAITAPQGGRLVFSGVGFETREIEVTGPAGLQVVLKHKAEEIEAVEVVMTTGYQDLRKRNTASSYSVVDSRELGRKVNVDVMSALEGRVPGLSTFKGNMVVRGSSSFAVGSRPLVVIDGLPTEISSLSPDDLGGIDKSRLASVINPNDVESITVLKDAAAAAIYGARAANGVIVITTKSGKGATGGKPAIHFSTDMVWTDKPDLDDMHYASTADIINYEKALHQRRMTFYANGEADYFGPNGAGYIGSTSMISYYSPLINLYRLQYEGRIDQKTFDEQVNAMAQMDYRREFAKKVWRNPFRQNYNLSVAGGNERQDVYLSLNYQGQKERMISDRTETFNVYLKARQQVMRGVNLTAGVNTQYNTVKSMTDAEYTSPTSFVEPYTRIEDENGNRVYRDYVGMGDAFAGMPFSGALLNGKTVEQIAQINAVKANRLKSPAFNILDELEQNISKTDRLALRSFASLDVKILQGLNFASSFQYEYSKNKTEWQLTQDAFQMRSLVNRMAEHSGDPFTSTSPFLYNIPEVGGRLQQTSTETTGYTWRNQLNFNRTIAADHNISAIAGTEIRQTYTPKIIDNVYYGYNPVTLAFKSYDEYALANIGVKPYIWSRTATPQRLSVPTFLTSTKHRYFSMYSTLNYTYRGKYVLAGSFRIDQADLFGSDPKYRYRPLWSVSGGWDMAQEKFIENINWVNMLKLRASYGITGNVDQSSSPYVLANGRTTTTLEPPLDYYAVDVAPNPLLRWERTATTNIGVDYVLLHGRLRGAVDLYRKYSDDLLATKTLDPTNGFATARINNGAMLNKGVELSVSGDLVSKKDFTVTSMATFAYNKNEVKRIDAVPTNASLLVANSSYYLTGNPKNAIYAYRYAGLTSGGNDEQNGLPVFYMNDGKTDVNVVFNGTGTTITRLTDVGAAVYMGPAIPAWNASFQQSLRYKGIEFNALFVLYGGYKIRRDALNIYTTSIGGGALDQDIANSWTPQNTATDIPKAFPAYTTAQSPSIIYLNEYWKYADKQVIDANYIRLRNVTLAYTLPKKLSKMAYLQQVKISGQVNNPWYWFSGGDDIDPDTFDGASGTRSYTTPASYILRLDVTF